MHLMVKKLKSMNFIIVKSQFLEDGVDIDKVDVPNTASFGEKKKSQRIICFKSRQLCVISLLPVKKMMDNLLIVKLDHSV